MKISVLKQPDVFVRKEIDDLKEAGRINSGLREENGTAGSSCLSHSPYEPLTMITYLCQSQTPLSIFLPTGAAVLGVKDTARHVPPQTPGVGGSTAGSTPLKAELAHMKQIHSELQKVAETAPSLKEGLWVLSHSFGYFLELQPRLLSNEGLGTHEP